MNEFLLGGQEQGTSITVPAEFVIPAQFPVPVGSKPAVWPNWGTRVGLTGADPDARGAGATEGPGAGTTEGTEIADWGEGEGVGAAEGAVPALAWMACACWLKVVEAEGHPSPGPRRFCRVTVAVWSRANWDASELSVGNDTVIAVLFTAWPAATLAFSA